MMFASIERLLILVLFPFFLALLVLCLFPFFFLALSLLGCIGCFFVAFVFVAFVFVLVRVSFM
jgi:hypothetical protein